METVCIISIVLSALAVVNSVAACYFMWKGDQLQKKINELDKQ